MTLRQAIQKYSDRVEFLMHGDAYQILEIMNVNNSALVVNMENAIEKIVGLDTKVTPRLWDENNIEI